MKGEIIVNDDSDQMIQVYDNIQKTYDNPLLQSQFRLRQFKTILQENHFPEIPLEYLIMMSNSNCIATTQPGSEARYRICSVRLILRFDEWLKKYPNAVLSPEMIKLLCSQLMAAHEEPHFDLETSYKIPKPVILPGVHCQKCFFLGMKYYRGSWYCPICHFKAKDAHLFALLDYYLIFGPEITNQQFRWFLGLDSADIAYKLLIKLNLTTIGKNKQLVYILSEDFFHKIMVNWCW